MLLTSYLTAGIALAPVFLLGAMAALARRDAKPAALWRHFLWMATAALLCTVISLALQVIALEAPSAGRTLPLPGLASSVVGAWLGVLVLFLGTVIGAFSSRYLQGEPNQSLYVCSLAGVLTAVQVLLLADHWVVLIAAWTAAGSQLQRLLCFYGDRPFALLAAHKKRLADRLADVLLVVAGATAWWQVGSGSLSALSSHLVYTPVSISLQASAVCLVLAVMLRTALLPVHGWLTQVMEAPTPVSALLHAGVVNLGGFVLVRFAPLLGAAPAARWLAVLVGVVTAVVAALVMLTRVSVKVRLAWSTVAQMGFMVLECGLGLYSLAMLHLMGHSLYKAHAFLSSSTAVQQTKLRILRASAPASPASMFAAPIVAAIIIVFGMKLGGHAPWPLWWTGVLALAWAPLLWMPGRIVGAPPSRWSRRLAGPAMVAALTGAACLAHALPFAVIDAPNDRAGVVALVGMTLLHLLIVASQWRPDVLTVWRRRAYAGFYLDEFYTRAALTVWPTGWSPPAGAIVEHRMDAVPLRATP